MTTEREHLEFTEWIVNDWVDMMRDIRIGEGKETEFDREWEAKIARAEATAEWLTTKRKLWETRAAITAERTAAAIIADMLAGWQLPGAVWFNPDIKRWRLTGEGYRPKSTREILLGIFHPNATAEQIATAMQDPMPEQPTALPPPAPEPPEPPAAIEPPATAIDVSAVSDDDLLGLPEGVAAQLSREHRKRWRELNADALPPPPPALDRPLRLSDLKPSYVHHMK